MEKKMYAFASLLAGFLALVVFSSFYSADQSLLLKHEEKAAVPAMDMNYMTGIIPDREYAFAGEEVPLENFDARERLDRELVTNTYLQSTNVLNMKKANRYFPMIESILAKYGIPEDFKYLSVAESNLHMATSSAGAKGIWQFMESSGEAYGLEVNGEVDERFHPEKSTEAACKFLLFLKEKFGSWTLAAAAYNMGAAGLSKQLTQQQVDNYYDLHLNAETSRYVFRIIAIKEIMQHPDKFGVVLDDERLYAPMSEYYGLPINGPVPNLTTLALNNGTTYRMLKVYNPWLLTNTLTNKSGKRYEIRLPKK